MSVVSKKQVGFTIVELLIVVVVIAILAAVALVAYTGISDRANAASATAAASQAAKKLGVYYAENEAYPSSLAEAGLTDVNNLQYTYSNSSNPKTFCLTATTANKSFFVDSAHTIPTAGGCAGHGQGGVEAVTNYALDPNAAGPNTSAFGYAGVSPVSAMSTIASDRSHSGATSLKRQINAAGQTGAQAKVPPLTLRANLGEKISWSFWVYSTKAGTIHPWADATKVSNGTYTGGSAPIVSVPADTWTKVAGTFTASSDMYISQIGGYDLLVSAGDIVWFDEFMVTKTDSVQNFADGNSPNWIWNGAPNNSTSTGPGL